MCSGIKQHETVEYLNYFGCMITNVARCAWEIKSRIAMVKSRKLMLNIRRKITNCYI